LTIKDPDWPEAIGVDRSPVVGAFGIAVIASIRVVIMIIVVVIVIVIVIASVRFVGVVVLMVAAGEVRGAEGLVPAGGGQVWLVFVFRVFGQAGGDIFGAADFGFVLVGVEDAFIGGAAADGFAGRGGGRAVREPGAESAGGAEAGGSSALLESLMSHG
jgi:hypothetical protein